MEVTGRVKLRSVLRAAVLLPLVNPSSYTHPSGLNSPSPPRPAVRSVALPALACREPRHEPSAMAEERAGPTSEPLEIIELGRPPLSHITPEGEEVVRPTLTPEQRHLRALAQLPLADLLSEDLDGSPAPAPAAPTASAAAGPPPPEVMHRLAAAHSEAEMVSMLVRAMLAGKQLRPGQVQREAGATRRISLRRFPENPFFSFLVFLAFLALS